jgi:hypothetical protein
MEEGERFRLEALERGTASGEAGRTAEATSMMMAFVLVEEKSATIA